MINPADGVQDKGCLHGAFLVVSHYCLLPLGVSCKPLATLSSALLPSPPVAVVVEVEEVRVSRH